jgi:hypothetical protein
MTLRWAICIYLSVCIHRDFYFGRYTHTKSNHLSIQPHAHARIVAVELGAGNGGLDYLDSIIEMRLVGLD